MGGVETDEGVPSRLYTIVNVVRRSRELKVPLSGICRICHSDTTWRSLNQTFSFDEYLELCMSISLPEILSKSSQSKSVFSELALALLE